MAIPSRELESESGNETVSPEGKSNSKKNTLLIQDAKSVTCEILSPQYHLPIGLDLAEEAGSVFHLQNRHYQDSE